MIGAAPMIATWIGAAPAPTGGRVELHWTAPPTCPDAAAVIAAAEALMLEHDAALRADAVVVASDGGYAMTLTIQHDDGARRLEQHAPSCDTLADLAALLLAVAADPVAVTRARSPELVIVEPPTAPSHDTGSVTTPTAVASRDGPPRTAPRKRPSGWLRVAGIVGIAELPRIDAGIGLTGAIDFDAWRIEIGVAHLFAQRRSLPGYARARAELAGWNLQLRGCGELGRGAVRIGGCIGPEVGLVTGVARDVSEKDPHASAWVAATVGPVLRWLASDRVQLHVGVDGVVALTRAHFALRDDRSRSVATGAGGVRATVGIAVALGKTRPIVRRRDPSGPRRR